MNTKTRKRGGGARLREALQALAGSLFALALVGSADSRAAETPADPSDSVSLYLEEPATEADVLRNLEMERGKSRLVRTAYAVKRVSVGDPAILEVVVINTREFQLVAKAVGATNVLVWDQAGRPKASIEVSVGSAYVHLERELQRILGNENIHVESAGKGVVLKGNVPDALAVEQAVTVARSFLGDAEGAGVVKLLAVVVDQQVMLKVVLAKMARQVGREFGTNWNALIEWGGDNSFSVSNFIDGITRLDGGCDIVLSDAINLAVQIS